MTKRFMYICMYNISVSIVFRIYHTLFLQCFASRSCWSACGELLNVHRGLPDVHRARSRWPGLLQESNCKEAVGETDATQFLPFLPCNLLGHQPFYQRVLCEEQEGWCHFRQSCPILGELDRRYAAGSIDFDAQRNNRRLTKSRSRVCARALAKLPSSARAAARVCIPVSIRKKKRFESTEIHVSS